ncbi:MULTISPECIES: lycopene cyclase domain-containing protein [unclassified Flavobacterium]|uniref:lycopene cyclase domain-containing protein n=1 Tax=unclassified Flavobacterium TaxID=196869 RepID=UPI00096312F9|nr:MULTISPECIES: lycopene cyclase domain-containing protein [unclassified Flavobacterium]MBN9283544.1 lycopene cyclase domain-containing protein [Flavobacterium sp.]OJV69341.1 MAG: lycopene cyclase [Flavobacterium sp. 40-81]
MKPYTYLLINLLTVIVCFIFSFDKRIQFNKQFSAFLKAGILVAIPFIIWDIFFTKIGVWWFNKAYTLGISIFGLPIEEWLFFICIPFSCIFTFFCLDKFFNLDRARPYNNIIVFISVIVCAVFALLYTDKIYTLVTAIITILTLVFLHFIARVDWIGKASLVFSVLMLGFFPVNGVLTGTGLESAIVNYNPEEFLNIRLLTIPIEDAVYGYAQFLLNLYFFKMFQKRN